mgnify:CR=1 FL=1
MRKEEKIIIKCTTETKQAFRRFVVEGDFEDYEEALRALLIKAGALKERFVPAV